MQDDLIERLRGFALRVSEGINEACEEAIAAGEADNARIAALEADNARLMGLVKEAGEALGPFAGVADEYHDSEDDAFEVWQDAGPVRVIRSSFRLALYRKARATLAKIKESTDAE